MRIRSTAGWLALLLAAGCSNKGFDNAPVDATRARDALKAALDSWKKGDPAGALEKGSPAIYVIDPDWQAGVKLKDYQIVGTGEEKDAHLHCSVKLTLTGPNGQEVRRDATFVVSTAPNVTVSRKIF